MGSVWQAVHIGLDTPCALKFIEGELIKITEAHERFEREALIHLPEVARFALSLTRDSVPQGWRNGRSQGQRLSWER